MAKKQQAAGPEPLRAVNARGVRLDTLKALGDRLAAEIDACESAAALPHLARQYREVLAEIEELTPKEDTDDDILDRFEKVR